MEDGDFCREGAFLQRGTRLPGVGKGTRLCRCPLTMKGHTSPLSAFTRVLSTSLPSWGVPRVCSAPEQDYQNMISTSTISLLTLSSGSVLCISCPCVRISCVLIQSPSSLPEIPITLVCLYPTVVQCTPPVLSLFLQFQM